MGAEELAVVAGVLLSVMCSYVPGVSNAFAKLDPTHKRLVMLGLLVLSTVAVFGVSCLSGGAVELGSRGEAAQIQPLAVAASCNAEGVWGLIRAFVLAVIANQATFEISPSTPLSTSSTPLSASSTPLSASSTPLSRSGRGAGGEGLLPSPNRRRLFTWSAIGRGAGGEGQGGEGQGGEGQESER